MCESKLSVRAVLSPGVGVGALAVEIPDDLGDNLNGVRIVGASRCFDVVRRRRHYLRDTAKARWWLSAAPQGLSADHEFQRPVFHCLAAWPIRHGLMGFEARWGGLDLPAASQHFFDLLRCDVALEREHPDEGLLERVRPDVAIVVSQVLFNVDVMQDHHEHVAPVILEGGLGR